jgi:hypothetical protein
MKIKKKNKNKKTVFKSEVLNVNFKFFSEVGKFGKYGISGKFGKIGK